MRLLCVYKALITHSRDHNQLLMVYAKDSRESFVYLYTH